MTKFNETELHAIENLTLYIINSGDIYRKYTDLVMNRIAEGVSEDERHDWLQVALHGRFMYRKEFDEDALEEISSVKRGSAMAVVAANLADHYQEQIDLKKGA